MNTKNLLIGILVALTVAFASLSVVEISQVENLGAELQSRTQTTTVTVSQASPAVYYSQSVSIPLGSIPARFVLGNPALGTGHTYGFNYTNEFTSPCYCPPNATCTCTGDYYRLSFKVYRWNVPAAQPEWANFSNGQIHTSTVTQGQSTYPPYAPYPPSATLFDGNVTMQWLYPSTCYYYCSTYYLNITVK